VDVFTTWQRDCAVPLSAASRTNQGFRHLRLERSSVGDDFLFLRVVPVRTGSLALRDDRGLPLVAGVVTCGVIGHGSFLV